MYFKTALFIALVFCGTALAQQDAFDSFAGPYQSDILPLLSRYCFECHDSDLSEADIDLSAFDTFASVRKQPKTWIKVDHILRSGQMPPRKSEQPTDDERAVITAWIRSYLKAEAEAHAGDPGPVVLRRLSNAEYTFSLRDLTGVATLDPAREFPVDGAAGEGFTNTGEALGMSPALVDKYLDAAKEVARHVVLLPDGLRFSEQTTRRDQTDEAVERIRDFYRTYSDQRGSSAVNLQGVQFRTNQGGRLPVRPYLAALLAEREALKHQTITMEQIAGRSGLSLKYLERLWHELQQKPGDPAQLLDHIRAHWQKSDPDLDELVRQIERWQDALWRFQTVGHIGPAEDEDRTQAWLEPVTPLTARRDVHLPLPEPDADGMVTLHLSVSDAGDGEGAGTDLAVWHRPRLILKDKTEHLIRELLVDSGEPAGDSESILVQAPHSRVIRFPAHPGASEFVVGTMLHEKAGPNASVQFHVSPQAPVGLNRLHPETPVIVADNSPARRHFEEQFEDFRELFPAALCYVDIVPVDAVVTLSLFHREDHHLRRLMLNDEQAATLDRMWDELRFISHEPLLLATAYEQLLEFQTQDRSTSTKVEKPKDSPILKRAEAFQREQVQAEPMHLQAVIDFADRAWRRSLSPDEAQRLRLLYEDLRRSEIPHEEAIQLTLARVLTAPAFLYKLETPGPGEESAPVTGTELASRLSYFLWSSAPDDALRQLGDSNQLIDEDVLRGQTRRMLSDPKIRRLAIFFACQWLHIRDFDRNDDKNEKLYPQFRTIRGAMYEESVRFFEDLFRNDRSILSFLDADHTFLNQALAEHYGIDGVTGDDWRRVDQIRGRGRGGVLGMATVLAVNSGASRTSPILRGNWVYETLLGERLPRPPANVPRLPDEAPDAGLTARQLIEQHNLNPACAKCHRHIDPYGFALEQFDAIGRLRPQAADTKTRLINGRDIEGLEGLRAYLLEDRRGDILRQFCKKLLGYALGRETQLSDEPLLDDMQRRLAAEGHRFSVAVEAIVTSPQFRRIRGEQYPDQH